MYVFIRSWKTELCWPYSLNLIYEITFSAAQEDQPGKRMTKSMDSSYWVTTKGLRLFSPENGQLKSSIIKVCNIINISGKVKNNDPSLPLGKQHEDISKTDGSRPRDSSSHSLLLNCRTAPHRMWGMLEIIWVQEGTRPVHEGKIHWGLLNTENLSLF